MEVPHPTRRKDTRLGPPDPCNAGHDAAPVVLLDTWPRFSAGYTRCAADLHALGERGPQVKDLESQGPHPGGLKLSGSMFAIGLIHGHRIADVDAASGIVLVKLRTEVHVKEATLATATPSRWHRGDAVVHPGAAQ